MMSHRVLPARTMWLLHAMARPEGARLFHLRGYGPKTDELREDVNALVRSGLIDCAIFHGDNLLRAKFTRQGSVALARWRQSTRDRAFSYVGAF